MKTEHLLLAAAAAAGAFWYLKKANASTVKVNGHEWELVDVPVVSAPGMVGVPSKTNVFAPKGSWGPHERMLVLQFNQHMMPGNPRVLAGVGQNVPKAMLDAAMADLGVKPQGA